MNSLAFLGIDAKTRLSGHRLGPPIGAAASAEISPQRLNPVLEPGPDWPAGAHVLQHPELSSATENPANFIQPFKGVVYAAENEAADHGVKRALPKGPDAQTAGLWRHLFGHAADIAGHPGGLRDPALACGCQASGGNENVIRKKALSCSSRGLRMSGFQRKP